MTVLRIDILSIRRQRHDVGRWRTAGRQAFTLLEVVAAAGLSLLLMAAVLSGIDLYSQVSMAGRSRMEQVQLARAILRSMERDIRSCTPVNANPTTEKAEQQTSQDDETGEAVAVETSEDFIQGSMGILGDATMLAIHISRPARHSGSLQLSGRDHNGVVESDLKSVAYFLAVPGAAGLSGTAGDLLANAGDPVPALVRLEGDRLALDYADAMADVQALVEYVQLMASEVSSLEFRYFDGYDWYDAWNSLTLERLPSAVEIILGFRPSMFAQSSETDADATPESSGIYRYVVPIPIRERDSTNES